MNDHIKQKIYGIVLVVQPAFMILSAVFSMTGMIFHITSEILFYLSFSVVMFLNVLNICMNTFKIKPDVPFPFKFIESKTFAAVYIICAIIWILSFLAGMFLH